jgi:methylthioxylose transferase
LKPPSKWLSIGGLLVTIAAISQARIPLGVPGEWVWQKHPLPTSFGDAVDRLTGPFLALGVLFATSVLGQRYLQSSPPRRSRTLVLPLFACAVVCAFSMRSATPSPHREVKGHWVLYDRFASGYFAEAAFQVDSADQLLTGYEARMRQGDVLHEGTHPPGLYLVNWYALQLTESSPRLTQLITTLRSQQAERGFRQLESAAGTGPRLTQSQLAALTLLSLTTHLLMCAAPLAVFGLGLMLFDRTTAWRAACLTVTIPALQVFFPKSDVVFATTGTLIVWWGMAACTSPDWPGRARYAILAASVAFCGMLISLAHIPAVTVLMVAVVLNGLRDRRRNLRPSVTASVTMVGVFLGACFAWNAVTDCDVFRIWRLNLVNHAGFYEQYPRTFWKWLLVNPIELAFTVGLPAFCFAVNGCGMSLVRLYRGWQSFDCSWRLADCFVAAVTITSAVLWLSGRNSGEAARLWCFLTPWLALAAASLFSSSSGEDETQVELSNNDWNLLLFCQYAAAIVVVGQVNGFLHL